MNALHQQFVAEARELIQQATDDLIAGEREGLSDHRIDRVFRAFHTLKGSAGVVDLPPMGLTLHAAEDVLAAIQAGRLGATADVIDQALACLDQVSAWVDDFEAGASLPLQAGSTARDMAENLRRLLAGQGAASPAPMSATHDTGPAPPDWAGRLVNFQRDKILREAQAPGTVLFAVSYEPRATCFFDGDDPLELMRRIPRLLALHVEPRDAWPLLSELDPFSCNLRLQGISGAKREEISNVFRLVSDQVRIAEIALPKPAAGAAEDDGTRLLQAFMEEQRHMLRASKGSEDLAGRAGSAARVSANALRHSGRVDWASRIEESGAAAISQGDPAPLISVLDEALRSLAGGPALRSGNGGQEDVHLNAQAPARSVSRGLRVDESKIDALVDLAGELLVVKNGFSHLAKRAEGETGATELARAIRDQHGAIERIAAELHAAILQLRMVPVAQVFRSLPRLVRDISQRLNKNVSLITRGETTESDKTIVDLLFEPLMHLVRNALDHGIETPDQRRAAAKPDAATITLQASRMGDRFVVEVIDDGRGIDPAVVRSKAAERGLLAADELAALTDEEALNLIFSAGFSTASEVSDISGRGVGMDVVRATIERIGGRVSLKSRVGAGTTINLDLPVNIALLHIMVVDAGGQVFGIPMDAVSETVRLVQERITRIKNNEGFVLHDRVVPICSLAALMGLPVTATSQADVRLVVVTEVGGKIAGLEVDAIRDRLEVVLKPMPGLLANARGYAGTTLLGDGVVLLVLDLKEILP
jgi:two-component system, chemotaxis family, sensor kinase CheA